MKGTLTRHDTIIPGVAFLTSHASIQENVRIVKSCFRIWILRFSESNQAGFCLYTFIPISDRAKPTFERL